MIRVAALVQGPTERNFVQGILAPHLGHQGLPLALKSLANRGTRAATAGKSQDAKSLH